MRSVTSSHRRLHGRSPRWSPLQPVARLVDELGADEPGHLLVHLLDEPGPDVAIGIKALDRSIHPFTELAGFTAPDEWCAFGVRVRGRARHIDALDEAPEPVSSTFLVDRTGREAAVLRSGDSPIDLTGPAEGTIADLCRRVLGLPTPPPPAPSSCPLWITMWLDRIMTAWCDPARRRQLTSSWAQLAVLHPGVAAAPGDDLLTLDQPGRLVELARAHTDAWPWSRLREAPRAAALPDGELSPAVTAWMDDGFYARWALGAFPAAEDLVVDLLTILEDPARTLLRSTLIALLQP